MCCEHNEKGLPLRAAVGGSTVLLGVGKRNNPLTAPSHLVVDIFLAFVPVVGILDGFNDHN